MTLHPSSPAPHPDQVTVLARHRPVPMAEVQGALALDLSPRYDLPPHLGTGDAGDADEPGFGCGGAGLADLVPIGLPVRRSIEQWSRQYAQAAVEIVGGDRPVSQLARWTSTSVHEDLCRRAQLVARAGGHRPGQRRVQPVRPRVLSVRTCFLSPAVVEAGVHVRYGERSRALAIRFERRQERWLCTALEFA